MTQREEVRDYLIALKRDGCSVCGESRAACLDFHHTDPEEKLFNISAYFRQRRPRFAELLEELKKCCLLCANCHRIRHSK